MWQQDPNPGERIVEEACSQGSFEFNDLQKFWNSLLGIATMGTNLVFAFLTTILAVSCTTYGAREIPATVYNQYFSVKSPEVSDL